MSINYFCDICGAPVLNVEASARIHVTPSAACVLAVEVITGKRSTWNAGHYHHRCVARIIAEHCGLTVTDLTDTQVERGR